MHNLCPVSPRRLGKGVRRDVSTRGPWSSPRVWWVPTVTAPHVRSKSGQTGLTTVLPVNGRRPGIANEFVCDRMVMLLRAVLMPMTRRAQAPCTPLCTRMYDRLQFIVWPPICQVSGRGRYRRFRRIFGVENCQLSQWNSIRILHQHKHARDLSPHTLRSSGILPDDGYFFKGAFSRDNRDV